MKLTNNLTLQKKKRTSITLSSFILPVIIVVFALGFLQTNNTREETFHIEPNKVDCVGFMPMKCLVVNGKFFRSEIEGFNFEEGTEYELIVEITELNPDKVPADTSSNIYKLIKIISTTKQKANNNPQDQENQTNNLPTQNQENAPMPPNPTIPTITQPAYQKPDTSNPTPLHPSTKRNLKQITLPQLHLKQ